MEIGDIIEHTDYGKGIILGAHDTTYDNQTCDCCDHGAHVVSCYNIYFFDTSNSPYDYWNMVTDYNPGRRSSQKSFIFTSKPLVAPVPCESVKLYNAKS